MKVKLNFILGAVYFIFILFVIRFFPITCVINDSPINNNDYMFHYYHCNTFEEYMDEDGKTWGYNPYWMSGYPENAICDVDNKGAEVISFCFSKLGFDNVVVLKIFIMFTFLVGPLFTYLAARNWGFKKNTSVLILIIQMILWLTMPYIRVMLVTGTYCYVFVSYLATYVLSLLYKYLRYHEYKALLGMMILAPIAVLLHIYSVLIIGIPALILYILYARNQPIRVYFGLFGVCFMVVMINAFWIFPLQEFLHYSTVSQDYVNQGSLTDFLMWSGMALLFVPGLILCLLFLKKGINGISKDENLDSKLKKFFIGVILLYFLLGAFGRYTPITRMLIPLRYHINMFQYIAFPAAYGIIVGISGIKAHIEKKRGKIKMVAMSLLIIIPSILVNFISSASDELNPFAWFYSRTLCNHIEDDPSSTELIQWIQENTNRNGRILIESVWSPMGKEQRDWFYMNYEPLLPMLVDREFIGGPRDDSFFQQYHTGFYLDFVQFGQLANTEDIPMILFDKDINTISLDVLKEYFEIYNVKWIIVSRTEGKSYFDKFPDYIQKIKAIGEVWIYEVVQEPSFILNGAGEVKADFNHIYVSDCSGGDIILKYHWMEGLGSKCGLKLEKVKLMDDPVEFIKVIDAPNEFEIFLDYNQ